MKTIMSSPRHSGGVANFQNLASALVTDALAKRVSIAPLFNAFSLILARSNCIG